MQVLTLVGLIYCDVISIIRVTTCNSNGVFPFESFYSVFTWKRSALTACDSSYMMADEIDNAIIFTIDILLSV